MYVPRSKLGHVCYTTPSSPFHPSTSSSPLFSFLPIFLFPCRSSHSSCPCPFHFLLSSLLSSFLLSSSLIPSLFSFHSYSSPPVPPVPLTPPVSLIPPLPSHPSSLFSFHFFSSSLIPSVPFIPFVPLIPSLSLSFLSRTSQSCSHLMHPLSQIAYE